MSASCFGRLSATQWLAAISSGMMPRRSETTRRMNAGGKKRSSVHSTNVVGTAGHASRGHGLSLCECGTKRRCHPGFLVGARLPYSTTTTVPSPPPPTWVSRPLRPIASAGDGIESEDAVDLRVQRGIAVDFDDDDFSHGANGSHTPFCRSVPLPCRRLKRVAKGAPDAGAGATRRRIVEPVGLARRNENR